MKEYLKVMLWGQEVGRLAWHDKRKLAYFNYNPEFLEGQLDVAPIVASVHSPAARRTIFGESGRLYQKLPSFIADSLPDSWGNHLFEQWKRSSKTAGAVTVLEKLAFIGSRGMGAFEFEPAFERGLSYDVNIKALASLSRRIVEEREAVRIEPGESLTLHSLVAVGTSAGGRQPKAVIALNPLTGEIRSGQIDAGPGFESYILKFGDEARSSAELELTYYEMALAAGIHMTESHLVEVEGTKHFLTKRFDRDVSGKLHTQTLAALDPDASSYEDMMAVGRKLGLPEVDSREIFRRMVFNVLANNTDDHNKNFTFIMNKEGVWRLSPAYDMTFIFDTGGFLPNREHCLSIRGKLLDISREDILARADDCGIRRAEAVVREVAGAVGRFRELAEKNGVREEWTGRIEASLKENLSSWGLGTFSMAPISFEMDDLKVGNARIESAYKGNYHLLATVGDREYKYVLRAGTEEHRKLTETGISNIPKDYIMELVRNYIIPKSLLALEK